MSKKFNVSQKFDKGCSKEGTRGFKNNMRYFLCEGARDFHFTSSDEQGKTMDIPMIPMMTTMDEIISNGDIGS